MAAWEERDDSALGFRSAGCASFGRAARSTNQSGRGLTGWPRCWIAEPNRFVNGYGKAELDSGRKPGVTSEQQQRMKELERENRDLRRANEILRKASAFLAQAELDRPRK